ncbi:hypothetical protein KIW84_063716 [Lathyrus oleraceus]|uniref:Uncharacterized protein n=1 Tax=Pisum sativum TaxID=3888 RepID=A0A9D4WAL3_PEA|nr:hypothetical protein KIW84_063716 [Pisum sativum]
MSSKQPSKLIPRHPYGTRKNSRRKMEDLEKGQENLIEDVNSLKGTMSKVLKALQVIASKIDKEDQPTKHVESVNPSGFYVELPPNQGAGVQFSLFGLPPNYNRLFAKNNNSGPVVQQVQVHVSTEANFAGCSAYQGPFGDPFLAYHTSGLQDNHLEDGS